MNEKSDRYSQLESESKKTFTDSAAYKKKYDDWIDSKNDWTEPHKLAMKLLYRAADAMRARGVPETEIDAFIRECCNVESIADMGDMCKAQLKQGVKSA